MLGASAGSIFNLILKEYFVLFAIATMFATPLSIWLSWRWLDNFTYRGDVSPALLDVAVGGVLIVALRPSAYGYLKCRALTLLSLYSRNNLKMQAQKYEPAFSRSIQKRELLIKKSKNFLKNFSNPG